MVQKHCNAITLERIIIGHSKTLKLFAIYSDNVIILGKFELRLVIERECTFSNFI